MEEEVLLVAHGAAAADTHRHDGRPLRKARRKPPRWKGRRTCPLPRVPSGKRRIEMPCFSLSVAAAKVSRAELLSWRSTETKPAAVIAQPKMGILEEAPLGDQPHLARAAHEEDRDVHQALVVAEEDVARLGIEGGIEAGVDPHPAGEQHAARPELADGEGEDRAGGTQPARTDRVEKKTLPKSRKRLPVTVARAVASGRISGAGRRWGARSVSLEPAYSGSEAGRTPPPEPRAGRTGRIYSEVRSTGGRRASLRWRRRRPPAGAPPGLPGREPGRPGSGSRARSNP